MNERFTSSESDLTAAGTPVYTIEQQTIALALFTVLDFFSDVIIIIIIIIIINIFKVA